MELRDLTSPRAGLLAGGIALAVAYPFVLETLLLRQGTRAVALGLAALAGGALALQRVLRPDPLLAAAQLAGLALLLAAAATGAAVALRLVPAVVQLALCAFFLRSLGEPVCIVHRVARAMEPRVPDWVDSYCRKVTAAWAAFFAIQAGILAALAAAGPASAWALYTGAGLWIVTGTGLALEFLVRKTWFRYYHRGWLDRVLAAWLPAENTAQGRRSLEYMERMRGRP